MSSGSRRAESKEDRDAKDSGYSSVNTLDTIDTVTKAPLPHATPQEYHRNPPPHSYPPHQPRHFQQDHLRHQGHLAIHPHAHPNTLHPIDTFHPHSHPRSQSGATSVVVGGPIPMNSPTGLGLVNPYWPEYHQAPHNIPPLNYYTSGTHPRPPSTLDTQARQPLQTSSIKSVTIAGPTTQPRIGPKPPLNQNQVHAQTHPWRIKVYNACLACRKKKIKCDGQPSCNRCERLGFECSYIEVPSSGTKAGKQSTAKASCTTPTAPGPSSTIPQESAAPHRDREQIAGHPSNLDHCPKDWTEAPRPQRRSSAHDAAGGSLPHSASRRHKEPPPQKGPMIDRTVSNLKALPHRKEGQSSADPSSPQPGGLVRSGGAAFVMDRDSALPDLYHLLVNSVSVSTPFKVAPLTPLGSPSSSGGGVILTGMDQLNLALGSPAIPNFTVLNSDQTDPDHHHSSFQQDPITTSLPDQSFPIGFVITNKSVIQYLVHVYFECFHSHMMIVDKEKFMPQLKDANSPPDPLLLVAICAAGAKYSDHEGLCAEPGNLATIGDQFLTHARILLQDRFDMPSMSTLQALLILYWCHVQTGRANLRFMYVGMAIRMAQHMGLNRPMNPQMLQDISEKEVQVRKTIWWSCYQADRWTSAALGKPMVISDSDCLVDYPICVGGNESEAAAVLAFRHMTDLAKILGRIILNLYSSTTAATCSSAVFSGLDHSLSSWMESLQALEPDLTLLERSQSKKAGVAQRRESAQASKASSPILATKDPLHLNTAPAPRPTLSSTGSKRELGALGYYVVLYHTVRIMLYRPFLHNSALAPVLPLTLQSPLSRCRESAVAIAEMAGKMITDQRSYRQLFNSINVSLCAAATVHRFVMASPKTGHTTSKDRGQQRESSSMPLNSDPAPARTMDPTVVTSTKSDLYYLTLLLRILQHCCRFSIEKDRLKSVLEGYLPSHTLSLDEIQWARQEIRCKLAIAPFAIRMTLQSSGAQTGPASVPLQQTQVHGSTVLTDPTASTQLSRAQQYQEYQQRLRQHQHQQHATLLAQARRQSSSDLPTAQTGSNMSTSNVDDAVPSRPRSSIAKSPTTPAALSEYATINFYPYSPPPQEAMVTMVDQEQLQHYQHELDALQQQHILQQCELSQHHQQQALQLEQAQLYQQHQQHQQQLGYVDHGNRSTSTSLDLHLYINIT